MRVKLTPEFRFSASEMGTIMYSLRNGGPDGKKIADEMDNAIIKKAEDISTAHKQSLRSSKIKGDTKSEIQGF